MVELEKAGKVEQNGSTGQRVRECLKMDRKEEKSRSPYVKIRRKIINFNIRSNKEDQLVGWQEG